VVGHAGRGGYHNSHDRDQFADALADLLLGGIAANDAATDWRAT